MNISRLYPLTVLHTPGGMHPRPAWVGSTGVSAGVALRQRVQQYFRIFQVSGVKALGEPAVDWCKEIMGFLAFALALPQSSEVRRGTEFPRLGLLVLGYRNGMVKAGFRFSLIICMLL